MENKGKHIDDISKKELEHYTAMPKGPVWDKLEKRLLAHAESQKQTSSNRKWYILSFVFILFIVGVFAGKEILKHDVNKKASDEKPAKLVKQSRNGYPLKENKKEIITEKQSQPRSKERQVENSGIKQARRETKDNIAKTTIKSGISKAANKNLINNKKAKNTIETAIVAKKPASQRNNNAPIIQQKPSIVKQDENRLSDAVTEQQKNRTDQKIIPQASKSIDTATVAENKQIISNNDSAGPNDNTTSPPISHKRININFDAGMQAGVEKGFASITSDKISIAPYIEFKTKTRASILLQPTVKFGTINSSFSNGRQSFYQVNNNSIDSTVVIDNFTGRVISRSYYYNQNYDSVAVQYSIPHKYWEVELPVLLKYRINDCIAVFGGPVISLMHIVPIQEEKFQQHYLLQDSLVNSSVALPDPDYNILFPHNGNSYTNYHEPTAYQNGPSSIWSIGYMLGFSYSINKNLFGDILMEQSPTAGKNIFNSDLKTIYTQPYLRLSLGYRLFSKK